MRNTSPEVFLSAETSGRSWRVGRLLGLNGQGSSFFFEVAVYKGSKHQAHKRLGVIGHIGYADVVTGLLAFGQVKGAK